jgi:hypothetical protein
VSTLKFRSLREIRLYAAGVARGMRGLHIAEAKRATGSMRKLLVKLARASNHSMVRELRAARAA